MSRNTLFGILAAALIACATGAAVRQGPTWRPIADGQLQQLRGSDAGTGFTVTGDCDSVNVAQVNMGQNTVGCDACTPADIKAGNICICCEGGGTIDMELMQVDPYAGRGGVDPDSGHPTYCGPRSAGVCKYVQIIVISDTTASTSAAAHTSQIAVAGCNPTPTGRQCFGVLEYNNQKATTTVGG